MRKNNQPSFIKDLRSAAKAAMQKAVKNHGRSAFDDDRAYLVGGYPKVSKFTLHPNQGCFLTTHYRDNAGNTWSVVFEYQYKNRKLSVSYNSHILDNGYDWPWQDQSFLGVA